MTVALLLLVAGAALVVRTSFSAGHVFTGYVNFQTPDSWYHMRPMQTNSSRRASQGTSGNVASTGG